LSNIAANYVYANNYYENSDDDYENNIEYNDPEDDEPELPSNGLPNFGEDDLPNRPIVDSAEGIIVQLRDKSHRFAA
jgi:hypothetical protein